jgi:hypothetical protein
LFWRAGNYLLKFINPTNFGYEVPATDNINDYIHTSLFQWWMLRKHYRQNSENKCLIWVKVDVELAIRICKTPVCLCRNYFDVSLQNQ